MPDDSRRLRVVPDRAVTREREGFELRCFAHLCTEHAALLPRHVASANAELEPHGVAVADRICTVDVCEVDHREDRAVATALDLRHLELLERLHAHLAIGTADHHQVAIEELERDAAAVVELRLLRVEVVAKLLGVREHSAWRCSRRRATCCSAHSSRSGRSCIGCSAWTRWLRDTLRRDCCCCRLCLGVTTACGSTEALSSRHRRCPCDRRRRHRQVRRGRRRSERLDALDHLVCVETSRAAALLCSR